MSLRAEFLERQLFFLQRSGLGRAEAQARLQQVLPESATAVAAAARPEPFAEFLQAFRDELGPHFDAVELAAREFRSESVSAFQPIWRSLRGTAVYAAVITAVAALLIGFSANFAQFSSVYESFDADLPVLTVVMTAPPYRNILLWTMAGGVLSLFWVLRRLRKGAELSGREVGSLFVRLASDLGLRDFWLVLVLALVRGATRSGMSADAALPAAQRIVARWTGFARIVDAPVAAQRAALLAAQQLGTLDAELAYLIEDRWRTMPQRAVARAELFSLLVNILVGVAIGMLVIAFYLPILKLGAVVG